MKYFLKIVKESIIIVLISSFIGLISGSVLSFRDEILYSIPIILLLLPSLNSLIGDISTILVSRLTTHLFIGSLQPKIQFSDKLKEDFIALLITVGLSLLFLIILGHCIAFATGITIVEPIIIILIIIITILILFISLFFLLFICAIYLFKRGKDPNNFLIPFTTSLADFLTPLILIIFIQIFI
ncbi:MAG: magnesium transporter [Promethearchaeota archaeon]